MEIVVGIVMKKIMVVVFVFMLFATSVLAPNVAWADPAEKVDVIIGFNTESDAALVHGQGWKINHEFHVFPFVACSIPVQAVEALKNNPKVAFVEEDAEVTALVNYADSWGVVKMVRKLFMKRAILAMESMLWSLTPGLTICMRT